MNHPEMAGRDKAIATRKEHTICRACHANCSLVLELEGDRIVDVIGDKDNPVTFGFSCIKGRTIGDHHRLPSRLLTSMKRVGDKFEPIGSQPAIEEIAAKLKAIIAEHGPRAVAVYNGTHGTLNMLGSALIESFMAAVGSPMFFNTATIDQPGKAIGVALHGQWIAGSRRNPEEIDVALMVGINPIVAISGAFGFNPARNIVEGRKRGMKLIVVDPRRTETAHHADLFLQPQPGEDPAILAGIIRVIIEEKLYDRDFVAAEANGLDALRAAVAPYTPEMVATRAGIPAEQLVAAARTYAAGKKGMVSVGTGPNMSPHGNLSEYLGRCLVTLCGHWPRAGEKVTNPGVLLRPRGPALAATPGPMPGWGFGEKLRVHGLTTTASGMPTAALADEILLPGEGQVKALIVVGGNPLLAFPDQYKAQKAMQALDLLVCVDPVMSATARLAHYVVAPTLPLEVPAVTSFFELMGGLGLMYGYDAPYAQYSPALLPKPAGSDLVEEWEFFFRVARAMGLQLNFRPMSCTNPDEAAAHTRPLDMQRDYSSDELLAMSHEGSPVPLAEVMAKGRAGHVFAVPERRVEAKPAGWSGKFELANRFMMDELDAIAASEPCAGTKDYPLLMISRRMREHYNSSWHDLDLLKKKHPSNPAFMHPDDLRALGLVAGDAVEITSDAGTIVGLVEEAPDVRAGCVSMAHCWGVSPGEHEDPVLHGGCTGRLSSADRDCDPYSWIPRMSAIPVRVTKYPMGTASA